MASTAAAIEKPKIKLFWLNRSRSQRILWLLEELKLDYEIEVFHRDEKTHFASPELKKAHPLGKAPVIALTPAGATESITLAESAFIIEYLLDYYAGGTTLLPKRYKEGQEGKPGGETEEWMRFRYFLNYGEGSLMPPMLVHVVAAGIKNAQVPFFVKPITGRISANIQNSFINKELDSNFSFLENQVTTAPEKGGFLCGPRLTGADMLLSFPLMAAKSRNALSKEKYPMLYAYVERMEEEPGYKKAVEKITELEGSFEVS